MRPCRSGTHIISYCSVATSGNGHVMNVLLQEQRWLEWGWKLQETQNGLFWDEEGSGGYFSSTAHDTSILLRVKDGM